MSMLKACSGSEVHMGKWLPFHSTHQVLPSNQISANKQIHTHKKYHNKLALVHGVKCYYTRKWIQKYGNIEWEKDKGFGVGVGGSIMALESSPSLWEGETFREGFDTPAVNRTVILMRTEDCSLHSNEWEYDMAINMRIMMAAVDLV